MEVVTAHEHLHLGTSQSPGFRGPCASTAPPKILREKKGVGVLWGTAQAQTRVPVYVLHEDNVSRTYAGDAYWLWLAGPDAGSCTCTTADRPAKDPRSSTRCCRQCRRIPRGARRRIASTGDGRCPQLVARRRPHLTLSSLSHALHLVSLHSRSYALRSALASVVLSGLVKL